LVEKIHGILHVGREENLICADESEPQAFIEGIAGRSHQHTDPNQARGSNLQIPVETEAMRPLEDAALLFDADAAAPVEDTIDGGRADTRGLGDVGCS
jgi:hypothetical protein